MPGKLLVIDDEPMIRNLLVDSFEAESFIVYTAKDYDDAMEKMSCRPDIILLDINMPGRDGLELCSAIREHVSCPVLFLTARVTDEDKIRGLMTGGDDYITKPFNMDELIARVTAHLRREQRHTSGEVRFSGGLAIRYDERAVYHGNKQIPFSRREFDILSLLSQNPGLVFDKERIYEAVWGLEAEGSADVVKEHIRKIRAKLQQAIGRDVIETVWGVGYKWEK